MLPANSPGLRGAPTTQLPLMGRNALEQEGGGMDNSIAARAYVPRATLRHPSRRAAGNVSV
jgi:hypothetical protein